MLRALSSLLTWSMRGNGRYRPLGPNPCFGVELYPEQKRTRYLTPAEYAKVGKALRTATLAPGIRTAIQLLLLTGARPVEIATLQWAFVDLKAAMLRLPDSKTGPKTIFLSPAAVAVFKRWPRHAHSRMSFPVPITQHGLTGIRRRSRIAGGFRTIGLDDVRLLRCAQLSLTYIA